MVRFRLLKHILIILLILAFGSGCRSIRSNRHARGLKDARQYSLLGADHLQQENYHEAGPLFSEALKHSDADERAHWGMAEVLWRQEEYAQAIEHMVLAVELSGTNPDLVVRLGEMHLSQGHLDKALEQADRALERERQHAEAWALKGEVLFKRETLEEALDCYQRALIYKPNNPAARIALADIYQALGRPQRALANLDRLADDQPTEQLPARAWMLKGRALASLGERKEAKDCLRQAAICANDNEGELLLELARLQYASGDLAEARICLGRAMQDNPHDPNVLAMQDSLDRTFDNFSRQPNINAQPANWLLPSEGNK